MTRNSTVQAYNAGGSSGSWGGVDVNSWAFKSDPANAGITGINFIPSVPNSPPPSKH